MSEPSQSRTTPATLAEQEQQQQLARIQLMIGQLTASVWAYSVLTGAMEAGVLDLLLQPMSAADLAARCGLDQTLLERMLDVLVALGLVRREGDTFVIADGLVPLLRAPVAREAYFSVWRSESLQSCSFVQRARDHTLAPGWHFTDPAILHAQGNGGIILPQIIADRVAPVLPGLRDRLSAPTAAFLDVGTGVGRIAIEMCRRFPQLRVVGIDNREAPLAQAERAVAVAGLADRIELRRQAVEEVQDREAFDLAWLPQMFLSGEVFARGLRTVYEALRPGGWLLLASVARDGTDLAATVSRLQDTLYGGDARTAEQVAALAAEAGYANVRILPSAPGEPLTAIVAQRPV
jgi:predicted O-methyltransferase YrrM